MLRLLKGLWPYRWSVASILALVSMAAIADLYLPNLMSDIVNTGIVEGDVGFILRQGGLMLVFALIGMACTTASMYFAMRVGAGFGRDLRRKVFVKANSLSLHDMNEIGPASLITRTTSDISQIQMVLPMMIRLLIASFITVIGATIMSIQKDPRLSTILLVSIPTIITAILIISFITMPMFKGVQKKLDYVNQVVREKLTGIRVIRVFNKVKVEEERFNEANNQLLSLSVKATRIMGLLMPVLMLTLNLSIVAVVWFGAFRVDQGSILVGNLMAIVQYFTQLLISLLLMSMVISMIPRCQASALRILEVLGQESPIQDPEVQKPAGAQASVEFKNVSFGYEGAEAYALKDISFKTNSGEVTAIIGGTGSGKTSILNLIPRFYDAVKGEVLVNGVNVKDMDQSTLRERIGYAPQKALLFSGTIEENLNFGLEGASEAQLAHALEIAQAKEFVSKFEQGTGAAINQGGSNLSGGQRQRLSIARAIIKQPEIYLFDDSFSALDYKTDAQLRAALQSEIQESVVIIVAQRINTVMDADRILVMNEGAIVAEGTHEELLKSSKIYLEIAESQLGVM